MRHAWTPAKRPVLALPGSAVEMRSEMREAWGINLQFRQRIFLLAQPVGRRPPRSSHRPVYLLDLGTLPE